MVGRSPVKASDEQRTAVENLAASRDRGEADRARAVLLTLNGWTSARIAEAFGVREDTVRLWRSDFMRGGIEALKASVAPGPDPIKTQAAGQPRLRLFRVDGFRTSGYGAGRNPRLWQPCCRARHTA